MEQLAIMLVLHYSLPLFSCCCTLKHEQNSILSFEFIKEEEQIRHQGGLRLKPDETERRSVSANR